MDEVTIFSQKKCNTITRMRREFVMRYPTFEFGLDGEEICAKGSRTGFDFLNRLENFTRGSHRTHAAQLAAATSLARSILPLGFRGICCIQLNTLGNMYLGTSGESFSRMKPGVSSLSVS